MNKGHLAPPRDSRDKWCGGKLPKDYQVELFLRGLTRDSIIYLPTGKGKTLVAAMILKRMADINPTRHGVFLVDRVPLVYQQAERLFEDTGLQIFTLCGENASPKNVRRAFQIPNGSEAAQRVVVVTVGCYINLLNRRSTSISDVHTMIFDEVHHAASKTAGHAFNEVIRQIQSTPQPMRPAVIGLTASP
ncbi:P-loop containing nucleoside triphosphate hydrolase protein, partial [Zopfochytrium polystomum]